MIIPIKQIILEFVGPMTATQQNHNSKLTPKNNLTKRGIPPSENGSLRRELSNSTSQQKPSQNIVADNLKEASKKSGIAGGNS